jgi:hypothetical protein
MSMPNEAALLTVDLPHPRDEHRRHPRGWPPGAHLRPGGAGPGRGRAGAGLAVAIVSPAKALAAAGAAVGHAGA